jgi:hypothetical protein
MPLLSFFGFCVEKVEKWCKLVLVTKCSRTIFCFLNFNFLSEHFVTKVSLHFLNQHTILHVMYPIWLFFKEKHFHLSERPFSKFIDTGTKKTPQNKEKCLSMKHSNFQKFCQNHWTLMCSMWERPQHSFNTRDLTVSWAITRACHIWWEYLIDSQQWRLCMLWWWDNYNPGLHVKVLCYKADCNPGIQCWMRQLNRP